MGSAASRLCGNSSIDASAPITVKIARSLGDLQEAVCAFLTSSKNREYFLDPYDTFSDFRNHGYTSLSDFIKNISTSSHPLPQNTKQPNVQPQLNMWFVVKANPELRGKLVCIKKIREGRSTAVVAELKEDELHLSRSLFKRLYNFICYIICYLLNPLQYTSGADKINEYYLHELELEKVFLRRFLFSADMGKRKSNFNFENEQAGKIKKPKLAAGTQKDNFNEDNSEIASSNLNSTTGSEQVDDTSLNFRGTHEHTYPTGNELSIEVEKNVNAKQENEITSDIENDSIHKDMVEDQLVGPERGIEGLYNSCYMDSLFFSMFYCTNIFDSILLSKASDDSYTQETRRLLQLHVVHPLRTHFFTSGENIMKLRVHLRKMNDDIAGSFMDVEELLYLLLEDVFKESGFIQYHEGGEDFMHLMNINPQDKSPSITVQTNFETSMQLTGNLKFKCVPSPGLVLALPRSDGKLVNYKAIIPNLELDISSEIEPGPCVSCNEPAHWEIYNVNSREGRDVLVVCDLCSAQVIQKDPINYNARSRKKMRLLAIICIRASHFVAFVRDKMDEWLFFDSMAGGYPEVRKAESLKYWLNLLTENPKEFTNDEIPLLIQRTFTDGHMCIYEPVTLN